MVSKRKTNGNKKTGKENLIEALSKAQELAFAPLSFQALNSMLEFKILQYIDKAPSSLSEIISALKLDEYTVKTLLQIGLLIGVVQKEDNRFFLTKKGCAFLYDEMTIANFNFVKDVCYLGASELTNSFKEKAPVGLNKFIQKSDTIYPLLPKLPEKIKKSWYEFDYLYSDNCFDEVFKIISEKFDKIFDIGGNTGKFERVCLKSDKKIDITMLDLKENIVAILNSSELEGCKFFPVDVLEKSAKYPEFKNCAILMSQFLDCFSKEQILKILSDLKKNVDEFSSIFILEPFVDKQNFSAAKFSLCHTSLYFTCMANGKSKMYEEGEMVELVNSSGLKVVRKIENIGAFDYTLLECKKNAMV